MPLKDKPKIVFVCTEDWFFRSHFVPLCEAALSRGDYNAAILTTVGSAREELEVLGLKVVPLDFMRSATGKFSAIRLMWQLIDILRRERPDLVHFIALKPILMGGLAALFVPRAATVYHLTGLGYLVDGTSTAARIARNVSFRLLGLYLRRRLSWLIVENPDDLAFVDSYGAPSDARVSMFGGAGVDPEHYPEMPPNALDKLRAGYVGRMIWSKGVDVLVAAKDRLTERGVEFKLDMYGAPDTANPRAIQLDTLKQWNKRVGVHWHGPISDVRDVWRDCDIAVVPTRTREGMPRVILEAAACGRPLIVTDVPGCRHFVRDGVEGLVVPPDNVDALADALDRLASDPALRRKMGRAARKRVLDGYTEGHIKDSVLNIYTSLLGTDPDARR